MPVKKPFNILIFNCGSSSLSYKIFKMGNPSGQKAFASGKAHRVGVKGTEKSFINHQYRGNTRKHTISLKTHRQAARLILEHIKRNAIRIDLIGHRFVHGGKYFNNSVIVSPGILQKLQLCSPLAPIHNPASLSVIMASKKFLPRIKQYVAFDSAFHATIPPFAYTYALPKRIVNKFSFRKYGFHGLSYSYITKKTAHFLETPANRLNIIACHLGTGGSSVAAIKNGHSIDTSMGFSPLTGLIMSTRCGDIDPMLAIYLLFSYNYRSDYLMDLLENKSGLLGISGFSSDIRDIISYKGKRQKKQAQLAFDMYIQRLKKYIGSYVIALGRIDALIFTDDIGTHNWMVREKVCEDMSWCGIILNKKANRKISGRKTTIINYPQSAVRILCVPVDEEYVIYLEGLNLLKENEKV